MIYYLECQQPRPATKTQGAKLGNQRPSMGLLVNRPHPQHKVRAPQGTGRPSSHHPSMESNSCTIRVGSFRALRCVTEHACGHTPMYATIVEQIMPPKTVTWLWGGSNQPPKQHSPFLPPKVLESPERTVGGADRDYTATLGMTDDGRTVVHKQEWAPSQH